MCGNHPNPAVAHRINHLENAAGVRPASAYSTPFPFTDSHFQGNGIVCDHLLDLVGRDIVQGDVPRVLVIPFELAAAFHVPIQCTYTVYVSQPTWQDLRFLATVHRNVDTVLAVGTVW